MAPVVLPTTPAPATSDTNVALWVLIAAAAYLLLVILLIFIRQCLVKNHSERCTRVVEGISTYCLCSCLPCLLATGSYIERLSQSIKDLCPQSSTESRGFCAECNCCGKLDEPNNCCDCFIACAQVCDCNTPDTRSCCDSICGPRRKCDFGDCLSCNCCGGDFCEGCSAVQCACACQPPDLDHVNCLCFELKT